MEIIRKSQRQFVLLITCLMIILASCAPAGISQPEKEPAAQLGDVEPVTEMGGKLPRPTPAAAAAQDIPVTNALSPGDPAQLVVAPASSRMVIKNAELSLLVQDTDRAINQVNQATADYGGYIISAQTWYEGAFKYALLQLGVPVAVFESAMNHLRNLGLDVLKETASGQDVSAEYVDLQTRLTNLQATSARVRAFLDDAKTIEEMLQINSQLAQLELEIEKINGQMRFYEGRSAFSTITVQIEPQQPTPTPITPMPEPGWNPGETFADASAQLVDILQNLADLVIWLMVGYAPVLIALVLAGVFARRWIQRRNQRILQDMGGK